MSYVWNTLRIFKKVWNRVRWNKWQELDREEVIKKEINKLSPPGVTMEWEIKQDSNYTTIPGMEADFSMEEMYRALSVIRKDSLPGRDSIDYRMLKVLPEEALRVVLEIFNNIWRDTDFPSAWREYQVLFINKVGKNKVRPISLSSCVNKLMERMVNERLV